MTYFLITLPLDEEKFKLVLWYVVAYRFKHSHARHVDDIRADDLKRLKKSGTIEIKAILRKYNT